MTSEEMLAWAAEMEQESARAKAAGDFRAALAAFERAALLREVVRMRTEGPDDVAADMPDDHRRALSEAHTDHPAMGAARKAGLQSMGDVAAFLGVTRSFVSQVLSGKKRMPADKASAFERRTGFPAKSWS